MNDKPIKLNENNDFLGALNKVKIIKKFLEDPSNESELSENNVIAIYGDWGSGKSSIMETLYKEIDKNKFNVIWYDVWENEYNYKSLSYSLFEYILLKSNLNFDNDLLKLSKKILSKFSFDLNFGIPRISLTNILDADNKSVLKDYEKFEFEMKKYMDFYNYITNKKILVFIDDIDRCEPDNMINILSSIKLILSKSKNIIFLFGIDKSAVEMALECKYNYYSKKSQEYLEKIFPNNYTVSKNIDIDKFNNYIGENKLNKIITEYFKITGLISNPRKIKRVISKYKKVFVNIKEYIDDSININKDFWCLIMVHLITLHEFQQNEFYIILESLKWQYYYNTITIDLLGSREPGKVPYSDNYVKTMFHNNREADIFVIVETLSPILSKNVIIKANFSSKNVYKISYRDWISVFENGICVKFLNYLNNNLHLSEETIIEKIMKEENKSGETIKKDIEEITKAIDLLL